MEMYAKALELAAQGRKIALGTVVDAQGSTPQKPGSQALIDDLGRLWGTLGGGLVEAQGLDMMRKALQEDTPRMLDVKLDEEYSRTAGPICGGVMRIFSDPHVHHRVDSYRKAMAALESRDRGVLITRGLLGEVKVTTEWVGEDSLSDHKDFPMEEQLQQCLAEERPWLFRSEEGEEVYVEPITAKPRLLIVGGGHVGQVVASQGTVLGFEVTVIDDREAFADTTLFPEGVHSAHGDIKELVKEFPKDDDTYIVLVSKGHGPDAEALEECIHSDARYIGMIGSRRKIRFLRKHFLDEGLATSEEWDRLHSPIGYDIGAVTIQEIGVSIAAQLVAARRNPSAMRTPSSKSL